MFCASLGLPGRVKPTVMIDHAGLAHPGRTENGATDRFACLLAASVATLQQADRLSKARMENDQLIGEGAAVLAGYLPSVATISDIFGTNFIRH